MSTKGTKLFDSSDDDEEPDHVGSKAKKPTLQINNDYAKRYEQWRSKEEMQKLKDRLQVSKNDDVMGLSESSESSTSEEEWDDEKEKSFFRALSCLKKKDPKIYNNDVKFFDETNKEAPSGYTKRKKGEAKAYTLKDHERNMILGKLQEEEQEEKPNELSGVKDDSAKYGDLSYVSKLKSIKDEFRSALNAVESSDSENEKDESAFNDFLKPTTSKNEAEETSNYNDWLKGELSQMSTNDPELKYLHDHWMKNEKLDEGEAFLRDYILNRKYIECDESEEKDRSYNKVVHDSDDEGLSGDSQFEEEREKFEQKYNFRFEEPDQEFIKRFPRTIADSLRRPDDRRRLQRQQKKEKEEARKNEKKMEIQRLKALKKKEILDKIQQLKETTGEEFLGLKDDDLEKDFDPEEYDQRMQEVFSQEYYGKESVDAEKPRFDFVQGIDDDVDAPPLDFDALENEEADSENEVNVTNPKQQAQPSSSKQLQQELIESCESTGVKNRRKRKSAFLLALEREKPKFDPETHKTFEKYFDEYYNLDFEDLIGDLPCRFKYRKVVPNDFGLSTDEILNAPDRELNQWVSLKKTYQYRPEEEERYEVQAYKKKAANKNLKKKVLPSLHAPEKNEEEVEADIDSATSSKKNKKKKKKKKKNAEENDQCSPNGDSVINNNGNVEEKVVLKQEFDDDDTVSLNKSSKKKEKKESGQLVTVKVEPEVKDESVVSPSNVESKSSKKKKKRKSSENPEVKEKEGNGKKKRKMKHKGPNTDPCNVDKERLKAYGINPKKFKKRMKYAPGANM